jgi:hypothetical protein
MTIYTLGDDGGGHVAKKVCTQLASFTPCMFVTMLGRLIELPLHTMSSSLNFENEFKTRFTMHKLGDQPNTSINVPMSTCTYIAYVAYNKDLPFPLPKSLATNKKNSSQTSQFIKMVEDHLK